MTTLAQLISDLTKDSVNPDQVLEMCQLLGASVTRQDLNRAIENQDNCTVLGLVWFALQECGPKTQGRAKLQRAFDLLEEQGAELNPDFVKKTGTRRPYELVYRQLDETPEMHLEREYIHREVERIRAFNKNALAMPNAASAQENTRGAIELYNNLQSIRTEIAKDPKHTKRPLLAFLSSALGFYLPSLSIFRERHEVLKGVADAPKLALEQAEITDRKKRPLGAASSPTVEALLEKARELTSAGRKTPHPGFKGRGRG